MIWKNIEYGVGMFVIVACAVTFLLILAFFGHYVFIKKPVAQQVRICVVESVSDSLSCEESRASTDSLVNLIIAHEQLLSEKYQYFLEKKDYEDSMLTFGAMLLGIVATIAGFFGYTSIKAIKDEALLRAESTAHEETKKYMQENVQALVYNASEKIFNSDAAKAMEERLKIRLNELFEAKKKEEKDFEGGSKEQEAIAGGRAESDEHEEYEMFE